MGTRLSFKNGMMLLAAGTAAAGLLVGCGEKEETPVGTGDSSKTKTQREESAPSKSEEVSYPVKGAGNFTYGMELTGAWSDRYDSFDKLPLGQELEKRTGFDLDMVHVENKEAMNLLLASGELPDAIGYNFQLNYTGDESKAIQDGLIYPMSEEFVKKNAPDYWKAISENPEILKQVKTPEGDIYGFAFILGDEILKGGYGMLVRDDWCRELGIELPETPDEFYDMLEAFKDKKGAEVPLCIRSETLIEMLQRGVITSPFHLVCADNYVDDGKVVIGYEQPEFKDVLTWLNQLYSEGLLDPNFSTVDSDTVEANILTGKSGASSGTAGSFMGNLLSTNREDKNYSLAGIKNLVGTKGDTPKYGHYNTDVVGAVNVITTACKDPETVAKYFNFGYTKEGHMLYNFGIEGKSYEMVDGKPKFTDLILKNPDGLTAQQALSEYELAYGNGPFVQDKDYLLQYYQDDRQKDALKKWGDNNAKDYKMPKITINAESAGEYSSLLSELITYRDEMIIKYVRGEESLDGFDTYLDTLKSMGIDKVQEILQNAVDEYYHR
ncbi:extracellular solute-binding protein [Blautia liquoris]|uniref:Extracellular solute-binding protein n=1 Tax=Blautia liquoris TaxID=2779518 RepID=A0A7M2RLR7_9FIRM|nr:extracellular solute-binding protein [Blautia liquoris]QOV20280.1 extracellular solute-binding protein [Blautia liquoris]